MTLRMVAGERFSGSRRDRVRLPTGSPVSTYCSTISRSTAAERASRPGGSWVAAPPRPVTRGAVPGGLAGMSIFEKLGSATARVNQNAQSA